MSVIGGKPKPNRVTVQVVENGKHYAKHTVYTDTATVDRLVRGALHRAAVERDDANAPQSSSQSEPLNQCDGCRRGLPKAPSGLHRDGESAYMFCSASRYSSSSSEGVNR